MPRSCGRRWPRRPAQTFTIRKLDGFLGLTFSWANVWFGVIALAAELPTVPQNRFIAGRAIRQSATSRMHRSNAGPTFTRISDPNCGGSQLERKPLHGPDRCDTLSVPHPVSGSYELPFCSKTRCTTTHGLRSCHRVPYGPHLPSGVRVGGRRKAPLCNVVLPGVHKAKKIAYVYDSELISSTTPTRRREPPDEEVDESQEEERQ